MHIDNGDVDRVRLMQIGQVVVDHVIERAALRGQSLIGHQTEQHGKAHRHGGSHKKFFEQGHGRSRKK